MRGQGYSEGTLKFAKQLRRDLTDAERRIWSKLRSRQLEGFKFRRQQPLGPYIGDFVCQELRLVIELDGSQHAESDSDLERTEYLESIGYRVLRFWNSDVLTNTEGVLIAIAQWIASNPSPTSPRQQVAKASYPLPQGERSATGKAE